MTNGTLNKKNGTWKFEAINGCKFMAKPEEWHMVNGYAHCGENKSMNSTEIIQHLQWGNDQEHNQKQYNNGTKQQPKQ